MLIAHISDLHITAGGRLAYGVVDTTRFLQLAVEKIQSLIPRPACVLITGDLVDTGEEGEYVHLREMLRPLDLPMLIIPGNHDDPELLRRFFPESFSSDCPASSDFNVDLGIVRVIGLDTIIPGQEWGALSFEKLAWLAAQLEGHAEHPTLVCLHHPPFKTGIAHMDRIGLLKGTTELETIISRHGNVQRVLSGHIHRSLQVRFGGSVAMTAPSTAHQVAFDLSPDGPSAFVLEPPGMLVHHWINGQGLVSHLLPTIPAPGPYPFRDATGALK